MRNIVVSNIVSLDGFYEGPTNGVMDLPMDGAFDAYNLERIRAAGTVLLGANSYRLFNGFWPAMAEHPDATDVHRAFSKAYDDVDVVVVSDSLTVVDDAPWAARTRVIGRDEVASLEGEIVVFGSRTMWTGLLESGLVDEVHLIVGAQALAGGTPLFGAPTALHLKETRTFADSDNVLMAYTI
ncbi:dihydrofolate reductase family protein [Antrihabitans cavernicola]|uniref:Deaminase n=1 Tax=Antrihabitans cavernicola TaxID=2495913 RepID=A0A5A7S395_9NOCA|nr:dihydrofolate reductase family protein [Spelaeibacter cavernicola]KAA0018976.1 deaminase [Spelaeibacter cavernicola]